MKRMFGCDKMNRQDWILIACILLAAFGLALCTARYASRREERWAVIEQDGREIGRLSLQEEREFSITCSAGGTHRIVIEKGRARVEEADCPDLICVHQGWLSRVGDTAVCLPHRIVVRIEGE